MATLGYARTSSTDQSLDVQLAQLKEAGCTKIFQEQESGAKSNRPQLAQMLSYAREGDYVVVTKLDRLARSMSHFWTIWETLQGKGVSLRVLNMDGLDTSTSTGK